MSPCQNLEPSLRDSSRFLSVKPNQWTHFNAFSFKVRDDRGFQLNPLCRHDITYNSTNKSFDLLVFRLTDKPRLFMDRLM